jgi:hypothetical protein
MDAAKARATRYALRLTPKRGRAGPLRLQRELDVAQGANSLGAFVPV